MKLIRSIDSPALPRDCALTIGNFDAVHIGHRAILRELKQRALQRNCPAVVMTFDPHPQEYFDAQPPCARLTGLPARFFALRECGVDCMLALKFNRCLARTDAETFIRRYLVERLRVNYLLIGDDFRFGSQRGGDYAMLARAAEQHHYEIARIDSVTKNNRRVSSTWVRELLADGRLDDAAQLLGRRYAHCGRVVHGARRGTDWGFPTINLPLRHAPAVRGVFAVSVAGLGESKLPGVASVGTRPTIDASANQSMLEVHLFNWCGDAYRRRVCVEFVAKIRDELRFDTYEELINQIADDARIAAQIMQQCSP